MIWTEIKKWARENGYDVLKEKGKDEYVWTKDNDPSVTGVASSLNQLATDIYNDKTGNAWVEYQREYIRNKSVYISDNEGYKKK